MEIYFQCDAGIWHVCCIKSNLMENDPTNSSDVLKCGSTTGLLNKLNFGKGSLRIFLVSDRYNRDELHLELVPNVVLSQTELWVARLAMITSITIFLLWATRSKRHNLCHIRFRVISRVSRVYLWESRSDLSGNDMLMTIPRWRFKMFPRISDRSNGHQHLKMSPIETF